MTPSKRCFDFALAMVGAALFALPAVLIMAVLLVTQGRPVFFLSERMKTPDQAFWLWKFRTMHHTPDDSGVSGGDKDARITRLGHFLRRTRLDELPQLWNILRGDISFVGPRPPLRQYIERFPHLYGRVLQSRPGMTGLATLAFRAREEALLASCRTPRETDIVYSTQCVPRKAKIDLIYQQNQSFKLDIAVLAKTILQLCKKHKST